MFLLLFLRRHSKINENCATITLWCWNRSNKMNVNGHLWELLFSNAWIHRRHKQNNWRCVLVCNMLTRHHKFAKHHATTHDNTLLFHGETPGRMKEWDHNSESTIAQLFLCFFSPSIFDVILKNFVCTIWCSESHDCRTCLAGRAMTVLKTCHLRPRPHLARLARIQN